MKIKKVFLTIACLFSLVLLLILSVNAEGYPEKNVTMVVTWSAGGSTDVMARVISEELQKVLGERFLVENREGAGGEIGWVHLANTKPDGYTIGNMNMPYFVTKYIQREECQFRLDDFTPIANIVRDPGALAVRADSDFENLEDFMNYAKENPHVLTVTYEGVGSSDWMVMKSLETDAGIKLTLVNFEGDAPARAALLGGHVTACSGNISEFYPFVEAGKMRVLGVMSKERLPAFPDVPTFKENGFDILSSTSRGIIAPKGFPEESRKILIDALKEIMKNPEFLKKMDDMKMALDFVSGDEYGEDMKKTEEFIQKVWDTNPWM